MKSNTFEKVFPIPCTIVQELLWIIIGVGAIFDREGKGEGMGPE